MSALISLRRHRHAALVVTRLPSCIANGSGNFGLFVSVPAVEPQSAPEFSTNAPELAALPATPLLGPPLPAWVPTLALPAPPGLVPPVDVVPGIAIIPAIAVVPAIAELPLAAVVPPERPLMAAAGEFFALPFTPPAEVLASTGVGGCCLSKPSDALWSGVFSLQAVVNSNPPSKSTKAIP
jgi:hypothetical protein